MSNPECSDEFPFKQSQTESVSFITVGTLAVLINAVELFLLAFKGRGINPFEILLVNLSFSDFLCGLFIVIFEAIYFHQGYIQDYPGLNPFHYFAVFSCLSSVFHVLFIGFDRLAAVKFPFRHRLWITRRRMVAVDLGVWIASIGGAFIAMISEIYHLQRGKERVSKATVSIIMLFSGLIFILIYLYMIFLVSKSRKWLNRIYHRSRGSMKKDLSCKMIYSTSEMRKHKTSRTKTKETTIVSASVIVVLTYLICLYPSAIEGLILVHRSVLPCSLDTFWTVLLLYLSSVLNPIAYFFKGFMRLKREQGKTQGVIILT